MKTSRLAILALLPILGSLAYLGNSFGEPVMPTGSPLSHEVDFEDGLTVGGQSVPVRSRVIDGDVNVSTAFIS